MIELNKLVELMKDNPSVTIRINGYTDNVGNEADNLKLSDNRAKAVVNYLVNKGIDAKRLTSKGFGEMQPLADNSTEEGRTLNRRTEFIVTGL
jgi:outer membrane protein OmpA-like peptidoglycan-associated protein